MALQADPERLPLPDNPGLMATGDQLKALLRSFADGDDRHFYSVAMQLAAHEAKQGHSKLADNLRELIDAAKARRQAPAREGGAISIARPKGELASLLSVSYPSRRLSDMVLAAPVLESLQQALKEQRHLDKLRSHGLHPRRKLLLVGPSGTEVGSYRDVFLFAEKPVASHRRRCLSVT